MNNHNNETLSQKADAQIKEHALWSMGAGAVPLPLIDIAAVTMVQLDLLKNMCSIYGVDYNASSGKALISALASTSLAKLGASAIKLIPGIGSWLGGASMVILSGASTYAMGKVFQKHLETGKSLSDFDLSALKAVYEEQLKFGEEIAKMWQWETENTPKEPQPTSAQNNKTTSGTNAEIMEKLRILKDLYDKGILSEEEYKIKKDKLINQL